MRKAWIYYLPIPIFETTFDEELWTNSLDQTKQNY